MSALLDPLRSLSAGIAWLVTFFTRSLAALSIKFIRGGMAAFGQSATLSKKGITYDQVCTSIGNVLGGATFEIIMAVVTAGACGALKAIKFSKLVVGAVDWVDDLAPDSSVTRYLRKHTGCFVAGTLIWTTAGAMPIEQVGLGTPMQTSAEHADAQTPETRASDARRTLQVKVTFVETDSGGQAMELVTWVPPEWFPEFDKPESAVGQVRYLEDYGFAGEIAKVEVLATRESGQFADAPVVVATSRRDGPIPKVELRLADQPASGEGSEPLRITTEHPVYSVTRSGWIHAGALVAGETVPTRDGGETQITSVRTYVDETPVYNLEVSQSHNYFVGTSGVLVHNAGDQCTRSELAIIRSSNGTEGRAIHSRSPIAISHDAGVQLGRSFLGARGLKDAGFVNPFEHHGSYGQGFDDVLEDASGNLWIAEYKGGSAHLNNDQMSAPWVKQNIQRIVDSGSPWGDKLKDAQKRGKLFGIAVSSPDIGRDVTTIIIEQWKY